MEKAVIDTNVLIYDYVEDSEHHRRAEEILDSLDRWVIPIIVIHEFMWFLKGIGLSQGLRDVLDYLKHEKAEVVCDCVENVINAVEIMIKEGLPLPDYKDAVILTHAIKEKIPLATFNKKLAKIASKYGVEVIH